jgi:hypothetical protein
MNEKVPLEKILETAPKNWGRWGSDDEIGTLNFLTPKEILSAIKCVRRWCPDKA